MLPDLTSDNLPLSRVTADPFEANAANCIGALPEAVAAYKDSKGFNIMLQAFPLDGKIVCREVTEDDQVDQRGREPAPSDRSERRTRRSER